MRFLLILSLFSILTSCTAQNKTLPTTKTHLTILVNDVVDTKTWRIDPTLKPDVFNVECTKKTNKVTFSDGIDSLSFKVQLNDTIDFDVITKDKAIAPTRIIGVVPNLSFTEAYIKENKGITKVAIPEVSELANILIALHKDAEKDKNMTDSKTAYYKRMKKHFQNHLDHPILDTIHKYVGNPQYMESLKDSIFSNESYRYYYALKMNACTYHFTEKGDIENDGFIREMADGWNAFDPMKDKDLMADFAEKSNFRAFYAENKSYYDDLLVTYKKLNPIAKMQEWLYKKFGFNYSNYTVYFSPLVAGAHSTKGFEQGDFNQTFMFIARAEYDKKYSNTMNELFESRVVFTEIDHNYVNPVSDKYLKEINEIFADREFWAAGESMGMYATPIKVFNEYMTFAVYTLYMIDNYDEKVVRKYLPKMEKQMDKARGFNNFSSFNQELLRKYQVDKNLSIDQLYLHMLEWSKNQVAASTKK